MEHQAAFVLGPQSDVSPDQILASVKRRKQSGTHLPGSTVGKARTTAMIRRRFHLEAHDSLDAAIRHHKATHPTTTYDERGFTVHDNKVWEAACSSMECVVLWWGDTGKPTSVYEEIFQLQDLTSIQQSSLYMPEGPRTATYCRVPARLTYNGLEGFDASLFWSAAVMMHTIGTTGLRAWDVEFAELLAVSASEPLPLVAPPIPPPLPADTPITPDTYFDLRERELATRREWETTIAERTAAVEAAKVEGNTAFRADDFETATAAYTRAIAASNGCNVPVAPLHVLYANRAASLLKLGRDAESLNDAVMSVELAPLWVKGHYRVACSLRALKRYDEAKAALRTLLETHPDNGTALKDLEELEALSPSVPSPSAGGGAGAAVVSPPAGK